MNKAERQTKSDRTRAAIIAAAQAVFAAHGYERATVRDIAVRAAIDPAMIIRYFGSKDELFTRLAVFDLKLPDLSAVDSNQIGEALVRHFLSQWEDGANSGLTILLRSAASNEYAAEKLRAVFVEQVMPGIASVGGRAGAAERAGLVSSQLLGLALCRYVLKLPPLVTMHRESIIKQVGKTIQRYVTGR
ncbi:MAG: TetR/AcrR family transcriptional regulator [Gammaproteobacteria bacterium]|nr:TetR/AcrR family transcriptional regulator [Gammaproteobacteria bacterium]